MRKAVGIVAIIALAFIFIVPQYLSGPSLRDDSHAVVDRENRVYRISDVSRATLNPIVSYVHFAMKDMTIDDKVRSMLMLSYPGTDVNELNSFMQSYQPSGFIVMPSNITGSAEELATLTASLTTNAELPVLVATDEEGGDVVRLPWDDLPGANILRSEPVSVTTATFAERAQMLKAAGISVNFGIVADIGADPSSFIYSRTFGADVAIVADYVSAAVTGEGATVNSTLKHFPGHGSVTADSHTSIPVSSLTIDDWNSSDAIPFQAGITAGADLVMFGHLSFSEMDSQPASLSRSWHEMLRNDLGFEGVSITDDLTMLQDSGDAQYFDATQNAVAAVQAGNDLLLYVLGANPLEEGVNLDAIVQAITSAVEAGTVPEQQINDSVERVLLLRRAQAAGALDWQPPCDLTCFVWPEP